MALCIWNSQPPPSARPRTAATTGTSEYLMRWLVRWKLATISSNWSTLPAAAGPVHRPDRHRQRRLLLLPDHQALEVLLGAADAFLQAVQHLVGHGVHLGLEADHGNAITVVPCAGRRSRTRSRPARTSPQQRIREALALVHRQRRTRQLGVARRAVAALGGVHAIAAIEHPVRQRCVLMLLPATMSSAIHCATCFQPAACRVSNGPSDQP